MDKMQSSEKIQIEGWLTKLIDLYRQNQDKVIANTILYYIERLIYISKTNTEMQTQNYYRMKKYWQWVNTIASTTGSPARAASFSCWPL